MQKGSDMICFRVDIQLIVSCRSYPLGWHADELEHEGFDAACLLQSEGFCVQPAHEELVEVLAMASGIAERRIIAVSSRNTVFSAM